LFGMNNSRHNTGGQDGDVHWAEAAETAHHGDCYDDEEPARQS
jgi:hypothetical protein